jgi:hypothetical protein
LRWYNFLCICPPFALLFENRFHSALLCLPGRALFGAEDFFRGG